MMSFEEAHKLVMEGKISINEARIRMGIVPEETLVDGIIRMTKNGSDRIKNDFWLLFTFVGIILIAAACFGFGLFLGHQIP